MTMGNTNARGRIWFITGASSGFGRAVSEAALKRGDTVVATGRDLQEIETLFESRAERALPLRLDITDAGAVRTVIEQAVRRFGRLDVVFNNAGYGHVGAIEELTDDELRQQIEVNLFGAINVTRAALPYMRKQRSGHFLQMSSLNGIEPLVGGAYYAASKFAIEGFSESLAGEVAHLGIKVTIIEPGPARTRFLEDRSAKWAKPIPDYAASVGKTRAMLRELNSKQPVDPARAARAIVEAVEADEPPLHLPLGHLALEHIRNEFSDRLGKLDTWRELSATADFAS